VADYYDQAVAAGSTRGIDPKAIANWVTGELFRLMNDQATDIGAVKIAPAHICELVSLIHSGAISTTIAKQVFEDMFATGRAPAELVKEKGLVQISDASALMPVIDRVIADNPKPVKEYLGGKEGILKFLVGQVMKATKGQANPTLAADLLTQKLSSLKE
jgi:aspartyl-tRNA(Asn)/glutamyl-tRNA(Gln) amidotransferase subunit B